MFGFRSFHTWYYHSRQTNFQIKACEDVEQLSSLVREQGRKFSFINWTALLQHLALLQQGAGRGAGADRGSGRQAQAAAGSMPRPSGSDTPELRELVQHAVTRVRRTSKWFDARYAGAALLASARLQHTDRAFISRLLAAAQRRMSEAYTRDLAAICKGLVEHRHVGSSSWWEAVFKALEVKIPTGRTPPASLATIFSASVQLEQPVPAPLLRLAAADMQQRLSIYTPLDAATMTWALSTRAGTGKQAAKGSSVASRAGMGTQTEAGGGSIASDASKETAAGITDEGKAQQEGESLQQQGPAAEALLSAEQLTAVCAHLLHHQDLCSSTAALTALNGAARHLPPAQRTAWAAAGAPQELLQLLDTRLVSAGGMTQLSGSRLIEVLSVMRQLGYRPGEQFIKAHLAAAERCAPAMTLSMRAALQKQYSLLGAMDKVKAPEFPELARALLPKAGAATPAPPGQQQHE